LNSFLGTRKDQFKLLQIELAEEETKRNRVALWYPSSPSVFISTGIEIQEAQYVQFSYFGVPKSTCIYLPSGIFQAESRTLYCNQQIPYSDTAAGVTEETRNTPQANQAIQDATTTTYACSSRCLVTPNNGPDSRPRSLASRENSNHFAIWLQNCIREDSCLPGRTPRHGG
jgi:hypothetical protein